MQDQAFDLSLVRGFGKLPPPSPPLEALSSEASSETPSSAQVGLGQEPTRDPEGVGREPEGVGQGTRGLPHQFQLVGHQPQCKNWWLAFVSGSRKANVAIKGTGFKYQSLLNTLAGRQTPVFFTFTGSGGTFLFAYEIVNGKHVIKICVDGLHVTHTPRGKAAWTVASGAGRPAGRAGLGVVFKNETADYLGGNVGISIIKHSVSGNWVEVATTDGSGNITANDPTGQLSKFSNLQSDLGQSQVVNELISQWTSGQGKTGGYIYFGLSDPHSGAAQTPGEPPGVVIMRFSMSGGAGRFDMLTSESATITHTAAPPLPVSSVPTWQYYSWIAAGTQSQPPASVPPGASASSGAWVWRPAQAWWVWYPMANMMVQLNGYWVFGNPALSTSWSSLPAPTSPPAALAGTTGTWQQSHQAYWVWIPTGGVAMASTGLSTGTLLLLGILGVGAVGGVGYLLLS